MASTIAAITTSGGGVVTTADSSGNLSLLSGVNTVVAVTSTGVSVTGTLAVSGVLTATGGITATGLTSKIQPITASVAASALTITLNPTILDFRASPLTSGTVTTIAVPAAISVTIPSTSTMGTVSAVQSRIVVIAINNAGTVELAAVNISGGSVLDETTLITTTAAAAAGNSATAYYSTTARTSVAYRVVGYVESTQATAGTWATTPSTLQGYGGQALAAMSSLGYGQVWTSYVQGGAGSGRVIGTTYYNTTGKPIFISVNTTPNGAGNQYVTIDINGIRVTLVGQGSGASPNTQYLVTNTFIIPPSGTYVVTNGVGSSYIYTWAELR
jgi:hypothetical protein